MQKPLYINEKFLLRNALLISKSVCCEFILWECKEFLSLSLMWDKKRVFPIALVMCFNFIIKKSYIWFISSGERRNFKIFFCILHALTEWNTCRVQPFFLVFPY